MATTKRPPLGEEEAVSLFSARASDARGGAPVVVTEEDMLHARAIVRLLSYNRAAILLAAARADTLSPREIAEALDALDDARDPDPEVRAKLARGEAHRLAGRLPHAVADLEAVLRESDGDPYAQAEAHRLLGAVYRAQGLFEEALAHKRAALALHDRIDDPVRRALAHGEVGTALTGLGRLREARTYHEEALAAHRTLGQRRHEGVELSYLGVALHRLGLFEEAHRAHESALVIHREIGNVRLEGADLLHLGYVEHELGRFEASRERFAAARDTFRRAEDRALEGVTLAYWGALEAEARRPEQSGPWLREALAIAKSTRSVRHEATAWLHLGYHHRALGEKEEATRAYERARDLGDGGRVEIEQHAWTLALTGDVTRAAGIELEDARTALAIRLLAMARALRGEGAHAAPSPSPSAPPTASPPPSPEDVRATLAEIAAASDAAGIGSALAGSRVRLASAELEAALGEVEAARARSAQARGGALVVAKDARWFLDAQGKKVDLSRRRPLRLALALLVERRLSAPGEGVSWEKVLDAAWPGERVLAQAGFSRVRNALAQLRKLGLRDHVLTRDDGYLLDPATPVELRDS